MFLRKISMLLLLLFITACMESETNKADQHLAEVSIAVSRTPLSAPIYVAQAKGFFRKHGVNVKVQALAGGHRCLQAVLENKADLATSSDYPLMLNSFNRTDYAVITTFVSSDNDVKLMASSMSKISAPSDLKSKTIGVIKGGSSHYFLDRFLLFNGLRIKDVTVKNINPEDMPAALEQGIVDAISVWEPYGYISREKLGKELVIFPARNYYSETFNLSGKKAFISKNKEALYSILQALLDATDFIKQNPSESQTIVTSTLGLSSGFVDWIWKDLHFSIGLDQSLIFTLENEARWAVRNGIVGKSKLPDMNEIIEPSILKRVDKTRITLFNKDVKSSF